LSSSRLTSVLIVAALASSVRADAPSCRVVDVDFTPSDDLQIVAWVEKADGTFLDTIYITNKTGLYGLGNRPGRYDLNSGPQVHDTAPYGRRENVFPVWAHRHGKTWPKVVFQNGDENNVSHPVLDSSPEVDPPYCRPISPTEDKVYWDTGTCATTHVYTDKGTLSTTGVSLYPPRADISYQCDPAMGCDSPSVNMYKSLNPFDAITQATPLGGTQTEASWPIPSDLPVGNYVMWVEVSKAFDFNDTYNQTTFPAPQVVYGTYGAPYRGQPSIVYSVPFTLSDTMTITGGQTYVGYGDPTGATGTLNPPDATITTGTPGSGASRLQIIAGTSDIVRVCARPEPNTIPPTPVTALDVMAVTSSSATLQFIAPSSAMTSCTGMPSKVAGYEIRYRANEAMTADNFADSSLAAASIVPAPAGSMQTFEVDGLLPQTNYWIGVRAYDGCRNYSDLTILPITTLDQQAGEVDACFIATAAYGSLLANDVEMLRSFRDGVLRSTAFGELAIETYYTFGPPVAGVVGESELLRATARAALAPIVATIRSVRF